MYVCICAAVSDRQIKQAARDGASTVEDLAAHLGVGTGCGCCREMAQEILDASDATPSASVIHGLEIARVAAPARRV
jgi:bacterioferritin-associated ferredoxin